MYFFSFVHANVDDAVAGGMLAKMRCNGAACKAENRLYVANKVANDFTKIC